MQSNILRRWASLGVMVDGDVDPYEDPEKLFVESLSHIPDEPRLISIMATWLKQYGHLLITRKMKFRAPIQRRLFSALIETSNTDEPKLLAMVQRRKSGEPKFLVDYPEVIRQRIRREPDIDFYKHGFLVKRQDLVRDKILLPPSGVYENSAILRNRALYGASLRSDLLSFFPNSPAQSLRALARKLHVGTPAVHHVLNDYARSGLIAWSGAGRSSKVYWLGPK